MPPVGRPCSICNHEDRDAIDAALLEGKLVRELAVRWGISADSLRNHQKKHLGDTIVRARKAKAGDAVDGSALTRLEDLYERTNALLAQAEHSGSMGQALQAVREARTTLESIAKITGELNTTPTVTINLAASPEWLSLQGLILAALSPFPDARLAVAEAIDIVGEIEP